MSTQCGRYVLQKAVVSGDHVEFYRYRIPVKCEFEKRPSLTASDSSGEKRNDNLFRARQTVRRLIWANLTLYTKFLTLTCADTCLDIKVFLRRLTTFFQAMKRDGYKLRYLYVLERQVKRGKKEGNLGSWHAHIIVFNSEKIPLEVLKKNWKHGRTELKILNGLRVKDDEAISDVGAYVCKYITKEGVGELGSHSFRCSKGLRQPVVIDLKADGSPDFGYFVPDDDIYAETIRDLYNKADFNYQDSKIVQLRYDSEVYQVIEYAQAFLPARLSDDEKVVIL